MFTHSNVNELSDEKYSLLKGIYYIKRSWWNKMKSNKSGGSDVYTSESFIISKHKDVLESH